MYVDNFQHIDNWQEVKNATLNTIGKEKGKYPDSEWKTRLLRSEHSPIRKIRFSWRWKDLKYWVSVHFVRHWLGIVHFVTTQRTDRTGSNRDDILQSALVTHEADANAQAMINISRRRLCNCASPETRQAWQAVKDKTKEVEPELAGSMVRECVYRNGLCPEMFTCGYNKTEAFRKELEEYIAPIKDQVV